MNSYSSLWWKDLLERAFQWPIATYFRMPVSKEFDPEYYRVISKPIDLKTMQNKLNQGKYGSSEQIMGDFELMYENAKTYNGENNVISLQARELLDLIKKEYCKMPANESDAWYKALKKSITQLTKLLHAFEDEKVEPDDVSFPVDAMEEGCYTDEVVQQLAGVLGHNQVDKVEEIWEEINRDTKLKIAKIFST